jgi:hypothetical protein
LFLATLLANFVSGIVRGATGSEILASITRYAIIIYAVFAAITQLGIAVEITAPTFLILLGAIALALAIAFGLGSVEVARDVVQKAYDRRHQVTGASSAGQPGATGGVQGERPQAHRLRREE